MNFIPHLNAKAGAPSGKQGFEIYSITGYFAKKLVHYENIISLEGSTIQGYSFPIIRLSDLYLMYAEASNETKLLLLKILNKCIIPMFLESRSLLDA